MTTQVRPSAVAIMFLSLIAGYSFGGMTGLGIAAVILLVIQLIV